MLTSGTGAADSSKGLLHLLARRLVLDHDHADDRVGGHIGEPPAACLPDGLEPNVTTVWRGR